MGLVCGPEGRSFASDEWRRCAVEVVSRFDACAAIRWHGNAEKRLPTNTTYRRVVHRKGVDGCYGYGRSVQRAECGANAPK